MKNIYRFEIYRKISDARAVNKRRKLDGAGFKEKIENLSLADIYTIEKDFKSHEIAEIAAALSNPITQKVIIRKENGSKTTYIPGKFDYAIEIGFLPGVTDNVANTAREIIEDLMGKKFRQGEGVNTSQITFLKGKLDDQDAEKIAFALHNPLISSFRIKNFLKFKKDGGMDFTVPKVTLKHRPRVTIVDLKITDADLQKIGKAGIQSPDGTRRGPLALDLAFMKAIQKYFKKKKRNPTDIELESLAQTWSEHCKHTIFADPVDDITNGLFRTYIKKATDEIRKKKGKNDGCISVFHDNSGGVEFDDNFIVTHKVETHNSPSALDPFGGSITGIVGVNRDTIGFGLGAKPIANYYGFCFASPFIDKDLYKGPDFTQKMLSSRRIMEGVIDGVNAGGNQSGIPTPSGFLYFDERYRGKPLVYVGTIGLIPKTIKNKNACEKSAKPGDYIVMAGGKVGKDGIHGATFSSEAMDAGSPVTAVQIGDPITQKKLSDAIVKEARDMFLYDSITDNGAGGLSCSVAEMAKESGGCLVDLEKVPLKYPGLDPWEIWISESQERMTLAVPPKNLNKFIALMKKRGVEATVIGKFTSTGKCVVRFHDKKIMDIDLAFLHYGLPQRPMKSQEIKIKHNNPIISDRKNYTKELLNMLGRPNIAGYDFISSQYDYIVQGNCVLPPLAGRGRINSEVTAIKPLLYSGRGIILSYGLYPSYSDIDTYDMAAASIDTAVRNIVTAGGDLDKIYLLDNFCWCDGNNPKRLWQLKRSCMACYDLASFYKTPFISGKDSMFNDFKGYDDQGNAVKISIPPTLLITSIGIIEDISKVISPDTKKAGDLVYILGETYGELGTSEYYQMISEELNGDYMGINVPKVSVIKNLKLYQAYQKASQSKLISSGISIGRGGLAVALAKSSIAGKLGLSISLENFPGKIAENTSALYSESQGRILVTIAPGKRQQFEKIMKGNKFTCLGHVRNDNKYMIGGLNGRLIINTDIEELMKKYRKTFENF